jgi:hypothetical protein
VEVWLRLFLMLALDGCGRSVSRFGRFTTKEIASRQERLQSRYGRITEDVLLFLSGIEPSLHRHAACRPATALTELYRKGAFMS